MSRERSFATIAAETIDSDDSGRGVSAAGDALRLGRRPDADARGPGHPARPATPETDLPTESDEETDWTNVAYTNRFVDASGRSLRLYADDARRRRRRRRRPRAALALAAPWMTPTDERKAEPFASRPRATTPTPSSRRRGETRASRRMPRRQRRSPLVVAATARSAGGGRLRVAHARRRRRRPGLGEGPTRDARCARRARANARVDLALRIRRTGRIRPRTRRVPKTRLDEQDAPNAPANAVSVSFFFPRVPYEDVATPHARGRVERFVGREIKRAVVAAVAEASIRIAEADVEVVGMSRGPPPAVARRRRGGTPRCCEVVKGTRFGNEDTTDDRLDHGFALLDERTTGYASDDAGRRARALAVHCAICLPNETLSGARRRYLCGV